MATRRQADLPVRLRPGEFEDLDSVMRIMASAFPPDFGEAWSRSQCAGILPMSGVTLTIADGPDGPAGFSLVRSVADEAELLLLAVEPSQQGQGIGQALLNEFVNSGRAKGATRLHLEVRDGNPAITLYSSAGFVPAGRRRNYYCGADGKRHDALTLMLID